MVDTNVDVSDFDSAAVNVRPLVIVSDSNKDNIEKILNTLQSGGVDERDIITVDGDVQNVVNVWHAHEGQVSIIIADKAIPIDSSDVNAPFIILYDDRALDSDISRKIKKRAIKPVAIGSLGQSLAEIRGTLGIVPDTLAVERPNEGADYGDAVVNLSSDRLDNSIS